MSLSGKVIVVTGGSRGLGLATATALVERGARVGILARDLLAVESAVNELGQDNAIGAEVDVADKAAVLAAFEKVQGAFGRLDGLVNNAGLARPGVIEQLSEAHIQLQVQTNFVGMIYCCQAAIPLLRNSGGGLILNVSSASVRHENEMAHLSVYSATKAAVETFSRELREELLADGIGVTVFSAGSVATDFGTGWDMAPLSEALKAWQSRGTRFDGTMQSVTAATAIAQCFDYPPGVTVDFMELKPHMPSAKPLLE